MFKAFYDLFMDWRFPLRKHRGLVKKAPNIGPLLTRELDCRGIGNSQSQADASMVLDLIRKIRAVSTDYKIKSVRVILIDRCEEVETTDDNQWVWYNSRLKIALSFRPCGGSRKKPTKDHFKYIPSRTHDDPPGPGLELSFTPEEEAAFKRGEKLMKRLKIDPELSKGLYGSCITFIPAEERRNLKLQSYREFHGI